MNLAGLALMTLLFVGCSKKTELPDNSSGNPGHTTPVYKTYTIQAGAYSCDQQASQLVTGTEMNFTVRFNSSAIYPAVITDYNHAFDVNKLWGFSEGLNNHYNSARIGWRYLNGQLQLLAYTYVKGVLVRDSISFDTPVIKDVSLDTDIACSIAVFGEKYIYKVGGTTVETARGASSDKFSGYQQYPYFGGTLPAPHKVTIQVK